MLVFVLLLSSSCGSENNPDLNTSPILTQQEVDSQLSNLLTEFSPLYSNPSSGLYLASDCNQFNNAITAIENVSACESGSITVTADDTSYGCSENPLQASVDFLIQAENCKRGDFVLQGNAKVLFDLNQNGSTIQVEMNPSMKVNTVSYTAFDEVIFTLDSNLNLSCSGLFSANGFDFSIQDCAILEVTERK